jgi:plastocyanin
MRARTSWTIALLALGTLSACADDPVSNAAATRRDAGGALREGNETSDPNSGNRQIAILDDCDPTDPAWAPTGGCLLKRGSVTNAEFNAFLRSPLSLSTVGHPSWRNDPSYLELEAGKDVRVTNEGGRTHTFTEVAQFGGGRVQPLNVGLVPAPECLSAGVVNLLSGATLELSGLAAGDHRFQCCIHPWMRALVSVADEHAH